MQATLAHYNTRHQLTVTAAASWVALKLVYSTARPYALRAWQTVSSEQAKRCYEFVILGAIALVWMSAVAAVWLGNRSREQYDAFAVWRDGFVDSHLEQPAIEPAVEPEAVPASSENLAGIEIAEEGRAVAVAVLPVESAIVKPARGRRKVAAAV